MNVRKWQQPEFLLMLTAAGWGAGFATWLALLNNFAVDAVQFTGREIGILQSLREVPGLLAFTVVFVLLLISEQRLLMISLLVFGIGVAITGLFPSEIGFYLTTILMSVGFHYHETLRQSLTLQLVSKDRTPHVMGQQLSAQAFASLVVYGLIYGATKFAGMEYATIYAAGGAVSIFTALVCWAAYPRFKTEVAQTKSIVLRKRYWLYYALTFLSGARRQIFMVFAGFMMVEKFGYAVSTITALYLVNHAINIFLAPRIGRLISHWGERKALVFEYVGLIFVFTGYAFVQNAEMAAALYVIDHLFFAFAIGIKSYFQKIANPKDMASTASVSFTINHIAAVVIPVTFGLLWLVSPASVFLAGAAMAACSLICSFNIPRHPEPGNETVKGPTFPEDDTLAKPAA
ncbi:MFS transporter [Sneathiella chinensis]|uniref:MFS transporter n=1 Tax=Sneathiella chinensis TaxID=349750 RepID=A0ABQ5U1G2_9PROT|nr:MFS transporter [Sneathiella chinensis]GLQ05989.1 MFS transporter [Sneathiella chinensis]